VRKTAARVQRASAIGVLLVVTMPRERDLRLVPAPAPRAIDDRADEDLMVAAAAGSRDALGVLVARHLGRLTGFCAKLVADQRVAEELAQDVLLAVWRVRRDYRPEKPFRVFLFTIASNRCRNHARSWRRGLRWFGRRGDAEALDELPALDAGQLDRVLTQERQRRGLTSLAIDEESALHVTKLPSLHGDPFDRLLVSQAIVHGMTILTPDPIVARYPARTLW